jgi:hypothetical protein
MLFGEQLGRCHESSLSSATHGASGCCCGHHRLSAAHVALNETNHRTLTDEVGVDLLKSALLRSR